MTKRWQPPRRTSPGSRPSRARSRGPRPRHARRELPSRSPARAPRAPPGAPAVLADLERGEVEAERLDLPAEVLQLAPGDALDAGVDERRLELRELGEEVLGRVIAPERRGHPGETGRVRRSRSAMHRGAGGTARPGTAAELARSRAAARRRRRGARHGPGRAARARPADRLERRVATASKPWRTWSAWMRMAWSVTSAVTFGFPSRSPPIHEPQRGTRARTAAASRCARCRPRAPRASVGRRGPRRWPGRGGTEREHGLVEEREGRPDLVERRRRDTRRSDVRHRSVISSRRRRRSRDPRPASAADRRAARAPVAAGARRAASAAAPRWDGR